MTAPKVGDEIGYISQLREPRVQTGWGRIIEVPTFLDELDVRVHAQWPDGTATWTLLRACDVRPKP